jgi:hypothetical protein
MNTAVSRLPDLSPSNQENVPKEFLPAAWRQQQRSPELNDQTLQAPHEIIPCDDRDYIDEFRNLDNDLYKSPSLVSSVIKVMKYNNDYPSVVSLGNEIPIRYPRQTGPAMLALDTAAWLPYMPSAAGGQGPCAPDLTRENNPQTFMILPHIRDFTIVTGDNESVISDCGSRNYNTPNSPSEEPRFIFHDGPAVPQNSAALSKFTADAIPTSVSEPTKNTQLSQRPWQRLKLRRHRHRHRLHITNYLREKFFSRIGSSITRSTAGETPEGFDEAEVTGSRKSPWVHARNMLFWDHMFPQKPLSPSSSNRVATS